MFLTPLILNFWPKTIFRFFKLYPNGNGPTFLNFVHKPMLILFEHFYSDARLEHDESGEIVVAVNHFLMNTPIRPTLENFNEFLKLFFGGESNEKGSYNPALNV